MFKSSTIFRKIAIAFGVLLFTAIAFEHNVIYMPRHKLWLEVEAYGEKYKAEHPGDFTDEQLAQLMNEIYFEAKQKRGIW